MLNANFKKNWNLKIEKLKFLRVRKMEFEYEFHSSNR